MKLMPVKGSTEKVTSGKNGVQVDQEEGLGGEDAGKKSFAKCSGLAAICPKLFRPNERNEVCKRGLRVDH